MQQNFQFTSTCHQRIEHGWEYAPSYVIRQVQIRRSNNLQQLSVTIHPTLDTHCAILWETTDIFSGEKVCQDIATANVLKYVGVDSDYTFYVRHKENFTTGISSFSLLPYNFIEGEFSEDDNLILIVERRDINVIFKYYK